MTENPNATLSDFATGESDNEGKTEVDHPSSRSDTRVDDSGKYTTPEYEPTGEKLPTVHTPPERCLSFSVSAPFAHFRKIETSSTRLTYGLPPRTTINGMIAAMLGLETNSYYELFDLAHSAISIEVETPLREISMPIKHRNTDPDEMKSISSGGLTLEHEKHPSKIDKGKVHQRVAHSMLRDVTYRINVWLSSEPHYEELRQLLEAGESYYTPSLGLSECLASIEYHGEFLPTPADNDGPVEVDSAVPSSSGSIQVHTDTQLTTEQTPAEMEQVNETFVTRRTTEFTAYQYREDAEPLPVQTDHAATVDGKTVIFK